MPDPVRLVDCGAVPALRSQTVFHAVAYALGADGPDTILLVSPSEPYVSLGFHQDADREVDLARCAELGLPVLRREVGGGAVYLDGNQLFCQWIFRQGRLPATLEDRFALYVGPLVETYRALGIAAEYRPINDIHVAGRKIGGTGAALVGAADVVVGSLMFDFDVDVMAQVLRVPSEKFRDKVHQSLRDYMTTMRRELGVLPDRADVVEAYVEACARALGRDVVPGPLAPEEEETAWALDARFASEEWLFSSGGLRKAGVKIHEDVHVREAVHKAPGGLIRATARLRAGRIDDIVLTGDFTIQPGSLVAVLERELRGLALEGAAVRDQIERFYGRFGPQTPGLSPADWSEAVLKLAEVPVA